MPVSRNFRNNRRFSFSARRRRVSIISTSRSETEPASESARRPGAGRSRERACSAATSGLIRPEQLQRRIGAKPVPIAGPGHAEASAAGPGHRAESRPRCRGCARCQRRHRRPADRDFRRGCRCSQLGRRPAGGRESGRPAAAHPGRERRRPGAAAVSELVHSCPGRSSSTGHPFAGRGSPSRTDPDRPAGRLDEDDGIGVPGWERAGPSR